MPAIGGVVGENLRTTRDWLPTARQLLTVDARLELPAGVETLVQAPPDKAALARSCSSATSSATGCASSGTPAPAPQPEAAEDEPPPREYERDPGGRAPAERWLARCFAELAAVDTETSLDPPGHAWSALFASNRTRRRISPSASLRRRPAAAPVRGHPRAPRAWLEDETRTKVAQNGKYDTHVFANRHGAARVRHDTCVQSYVLRATSRTTWTALRSAICG